MKLNLFVLDVVLNSKRESDFVSFLFKKWLHLKESCVSFFLFAVKFLILAIKIFLQLIKVMLLLF